ncbi:CoA ester lyase [Streptomyces sp. SS1-1]|uniref:HpcH/HpaI aldolase/citrate lyase family protein n=1 Tax=Streptomyces sp. SS1-1 TaxID=2651869 RepID=UPI0012506EA2|nr:CoA ester lyase [Streptomyces sp. SS1-1]KAB2977614.1 CoA ester lyase [Streptomyces sp. SS1-1]
MRSALYVPADRPDMLAKALDRGADSLIVDLEDAVAPDAKETARGICAAWLEGLPPADERPGGPEIWVRVNPGALGRDDARAVASPAVTGLIVAKTERVGDLVAVAGELEAAPWISLCPLLESASALLSAPLIARGPRVTRMQLGEADLCADAGIEPGPDERELLWPRTQLVLACAAAGLAAPLAPVSTDFRDLDALRESTRALKRLGFGGRSCIHPAQIPVVNEVFTPSPEEVEGARALVRRFEEAGSGVTRDDSGRMIDEAVIRGARRILAAVPSGR